MLKKPFTLDRTVRTVGSILIIAGIILLVNRLSSVLLPFFAAWLLAYMLNPLVEFLQNKVKIKNRTVSVILVFLIIIGIIAAFIALAASSIRSEMIEVNNLVKSYLGQGRDRQLPEALQTFLGQTFFAFDLSQWIEHDSFNQTMKELVPKAFDFVSASFQYIAGLVVVFLFCLYLFFILKDFNNLSENWQQFIPKKYRSFADQLMSDLGMGMNTYFRKQALISLIVGLLFAIGFSIIGLPMGFLMGLLVGLLNMIPYMHSLGIIPPVFVALVQSAQEGTSFWLLVLWIVLTFCIVQLILDLILTPKIMGQATGLHPAVILLALSIWGSLMGIMGMIIALPVTTLIVSYYKHFIIEQKELPE